MGEQGSRLMPSPALADALTDFARPLPRAEPAGVNPPLAQPTRPVPPPQPGVNERIAAEVERARAQLAEQLASEHEAAIAKERERHEREMAELSSRFGKEAADLVESRLSAMEARLVELTTAVAARILGANLADELRQRAIDQLAEKIRNAMSDNEAVRVRVRGATSLCQAMEGALGDRSEQIDFVADDGFDLSVTIDDSIYETRLSEWSAAMAELLA
jgi:hypothetical protein